MNSLSAGRIAGGLLLIGAAVTFLVGYAPKNAPPPLAATIYFDRGTDLRADQAQLVEEIGRRLGESPADWTVTIDGYAAPGSDPEADKTLSQERTALIADQLVARGLSLDRIKTVPHGGVAASPIAQGETERDWRARQARVQITAEPRR